MACALCLVAAPARAAFAPRVPLHARARHRPLCRLATHARACAARPSADDAEPGPRGAGADGATAADEELNLLQTQLFAAIADEDYARACTLRDRIAASAGDASDSSWDAHDVPDWLSDWLGRLRFGAPTRVQLNALRAMGSDGDRDLVISAPTGSGKTLAYLLPALTALSDQLMQARDLGHSLCYFSASISAACRIAGGPRRLPPIRARRPSPRTAPPAVDRRPHASGDGGRADERTRRAGPSHRHAFHPSRRS